VLSARGHGGAEGAADEQGLKRASILRAHGMPAAVGVLQHLGDLSTKQAADFKRKAASFMTSEFGDHAKLVASSPAQAAFAFKRQALAEAQAAGGGFKADTAVPAFGAASSGAATNPPLGAPAAVSKAALAQGSGVADVEALLRAIGACAHRALGWRDQRPYLLADQIALLAENTSVEAATTGMSTAQADAVAPGSGAVVAVPVLAVSGYLRGAPLNANQLVHVPGVGARRVLRVTAPLDPCPPRAHRASSRAAAALSALSAWCAVVAESDPSRCEPLEQTACPDTLGGEQTWPNLEEYAQSGTAAGRAEGGGGGGMEDDDEGGGAAAGKPRRPPGVSEYQAAWLGEDGEEGDGEDGEGEEAMADGDAGFLSLGSAAGAKVLLRREAHPGEAQEEEDEGDDAFAFLKDDGLKLDGLDYEMSAEELTRERYMQRAARAQEELEFPDEVDCPVDSAASDRFARYRSLENFRHSPWDAKESLPRAYSRLFDLGNFKAAQRRVLATDAEAAHKAERWRLLRAGVAGAAAARGAGSAGSVGGASGEGMEEGDGNSSVATGASGGTTLGLGLELPGGGVSSDEEDMDGGSSVSRRHGLGRLNWVATGSYVTVFVAAKPDTPQPDTAGAAAAAPSLSFAQDAAAFAGLAAGHAGCAAPVVFHGLHRHENRLSLLHLHVQRAQPLFLEDDEVVASKEPMVVVCGFRRWSGRPIFSQNNLNSDKHKFERFLQGGAGYFAVASLYGPATFSPAPALLFRERPLSGANPTPSGFAGPASLGGARALLGGAAALLGSGGASAPDSSAGSSGELQLVAQGSLASVDTNRIVLKKIVLTGYPARVHKRTAVIKHMFYSPEDVAWFKPCPLHTKHGLEGHIMGPVGTHGLFKVHFGRPVQGHDTVCLNLYKRVYPKFLTGPEEEDDDDGAGALTLKVH